MGLFKPKKKDTPMTDEEIEAKAAELDVEIGKMEEAGLQHSNPKMALTRQERMKLEAEREMRRQKKRQGR